MGNAKLRPSVRGGARIGNRLWLPTQGYLGQRFAKAVTLGSPTTDARNTSVNTNPFTFNHTSATGNVLVLWMARSNSGSGVVSGVCTVGGVTARAAGSAYLAGNGRNALHAWLVNKCDFSSPAAAIGVQAVSITPSAGDRDPMAVAVDVSDPCAIGGRVNAAFNTASTSISVDCPAQHLASLLVGAAIWGTGQAQAFSFNSGWTGLTTVRSDTGTSGGGTNGTVATRTPAALGANTFQCTAGGSGANDDDRNAIAFELLPF